MKEGGRTCACPWWEGVHRGGGDFSSLKAFLLPFSPCGGNFGYVFPRMGRFFSQFKGLFAPFFHVEAFLLRLPPSPFPPSPFPPSPFPPSPFPLSPFPPSPFPPSPIPPSPFLPSPFPPSPFPPSPFPPSPFPLPRTLRTQSPSHHPIFNPLPSSPCPNNTHPHATHYLSPFQNFQLCQFSPPQHHFTSPRFPSPNFPLPTFLFHTITPPTLLISSSPKSPPLQHHYCTPPSPQPHSIFLSYLLNFLSLNSSSNIIHYTAHSSHTKFSIQHFT